MLACSWTVAATRARSPLGAPGIGFRSSARRNSMPMRSISLMAEGYPAMAQELPALFRTAMRRLAASVSIVVAKGDDGPIGIAATSITSLTVDPPAVLVCVSRSASLHACLEPTAPLSVNLLSRHQRDVSAAFGGGIARSERFKVGSWGE